MELLWLIIIVIGIVSKVSENKKKQEQRQRELQQRRSTMTGTGQGQARPVEPQARPVRQAQSASQRPPASAPTRTSSPRGEESLEGLPEGLQSLIRMFTGEEEVKKDRQRVQLELERRRREEAREREMLEAARMEEKEEERKSEWADEWVDPDEIQDLPDFITDEQMALDEQEMATSTLWNLSQARKGVIWNEILERPRFRTQGKHTRTP